MNQSYCPYLGVFHIVSRTVVGFLLWRSKFCFYSKKVKHSFGRTLYSGICSDTYVHCTYLSFLFTFIVLIPYHF